MKARGIIQGKKSNEITKGSFNIFNKLVSSLEIQKLTKEFILHILALGKYHR